MNGPVLRDIHLPPAHWWPPALGWWLLAALILLAAICVAWWLRHRTRGSPLHTALREIDALEAAHARDGNTVHLADEASRLMRRVARRVAPDAAAQTGAAWDAFVRSHAQNETARHAFDELASVRFRVQPTLDASALLAALRVWCRDALRTRAFTPFRRKGVAPKARGDERREAKAIPLGRAARAFAALRPSFRRGEQIPFGLNGVEPQTRGDETTVQYTPRKPAP